MNNQPNTHSRLAGKKLALSIAVALACAPSILFAANPNTNANPNPNPNTAKATGPIKATTGTQQQAHKRHNQNQNQSHNQNNTELSFELNQPARLASILEQALATQQHQDIYWPAARLVMHSGDTQAEALRQQVLQQLDTMHSRYPEITQHLSTQVANWRLGAQPYGTINIYHARQSINHNPLLPAGRYTLILPPRPQHIEVFGFTESPGPRAFTAAQTLHGFKRNEAENQQLHPKHNPEHVYLQRNNTQVQLPWGTHNAGGQQLQPGDILFIGPRQASASGLLPVGKLGRAMRHPEAKALETNLQQLLPYIVPNIAPSIVANTATTQPATSTQTQPPAPAWRHLLRPHQLHRSSSWEQQNASSLGPHHTEHARRLTYNNYGHFGLMQMPSGRNAPAGAFNISYNDMNEYYRYTASIQLYDWLQASAFYLRVPNRLYSRFASFSGDTILTDKGFDAKVRLIKESAYLPELSVGLVDMAGTGLLSSEYIAASKAVGPLDFTLGVGFGRMGTANNIKNPFCHFGDSACNRPSGFSGKGGKFEIDKWFRGNAALFAGVEYQTPINRLRLKLEYESNDYSRDRAGVRINQKTPFNVGANWQLSNSIDLSLNFERGDVLTFGINIRPNFNRMPHIQLMPNRNAPVLADAGQQPRQPELAQVNWDRVTTRVRSQRGYTAEEFYLAPAHNDPERYRLTLYAHPWRLRDAQDRVDRTARALLSDIPTSISEIEIVEQVSRQPQVAYEIDADAYRLRIANADPAVPPEHAIQHVRRIEPTARPTEPRTAVYNFGSAATHDGTTEAPVNQWLFHHGEPTSKPNYGVRVNMRQGYGSPETFMFYQLQAVPFSTWQINRNTQLHGSLGINILNNYDKFNFLIDGFQSPVPRVRSHVRAYMQNDVWLNRLQTSYYKALTPAWHANLYGGYLEQMYAGVGGELLYRGLDSPFAFGIDINRVRQRDFNGVFGFNDYEVTTGFASMYYDLEQHVPWLAGGLVTARFGQFLAGDKGVHLNFQRRFDSGIILGAYAAFTDISTADFGEGSFNKGFFIEIPFELFSVNPSRGRLGYGWSPLTRDGGQMLETNMSLWSITDERAPFINK